jgi:hypothetical protein
MIHAPREEKKEKEKRKVLMLDTILLSYLYFTGAM